MILRFLFHLVFLSVFLFGSTFSCSAFTENMMEHGHEEEIAHSHESDDCCPKDGHKKQVENKNISQNIQKKPYDFNLIPPKKEGEIFLQKIEYKTSATQYKSPRYDKQDFFFTDTIKLLI